MAAPPSQFPDPAATAPPHPAPRFAFQAAPVQVPPQQQQQFQQFQQLQQFQFQLRPASTSPPQQHLFINSTPMTSMHNAANAPRSASPPNPSSTGTAQTTPGHARKRIPASKTVILERAFQENPKPDKDTRTSLAAETDLPVRNIQVCSLREKCLEFYY